jgi:hypothetical protein
MIVAGLVGHRLVTVWSRAMPPERDKRVHRVGRDPHRAPDVHRLEVAGGDELVYSRSADGAHCAASMAVSRSGTTAVVTRHRER